MGLVASHKKLIEKDIKMDHLPSDLREEICYRSVDWEYTPGELVIVQSDICDGLITILDGEVEISFATSRGRQHVLARRSAGEIIGEIGLVIGSRRTAQARAITPLRAQLLPKTEYFRLAASFPRLDVATSRMAMKRLQAANMGQVLRELYGKAIWKALNV